MYDTIARGKHLLEQLGGKTLVMALLSHEDPNVRSTFNFYVLFIEGGWLN